MGNFDPTSFYLSKFKLLEVALNIRRSTLYTLVEAGEIPHFRFGRLIRFKKQDIDLWTEGHREEVSDPGKRAREILKGVKAPNMNIDHIVKKSIEEAKRSRYNLTHGKPDRNKGLRQEVNYGAL